MYLVSGLKRVFIIGLLLLSTFNSHANLRIIYTFEGKKFESLIDKFSQHENIPIESKWYHQGDLRVELLELIEKGQAPHAVIIPADHVGLHDWVNYSDISPDLQSDKISHTVWQNNTSDGRIYGVPIIQGNHLVLYYNKSLVNNPLGSWDELKPIASQSKSNLDKHNAKLMAWPVHEPYWLIPFLSAFGGWPIENDKITLDNESMILALEFVKQLVDQEFVEKDCNYDCAYQLFSDGKLAYNINGDWAYTGYKKKLGSNLGVAVLPRLGDSRKLMSMYSTHNLAFPADSLQGEHRKALLKLIAFFQSETVQNQIWPVLGVMPVHHGAFEQVKQDLSGNELIMLEALEKSRPMPISASMSKAWSAMRKGMIRHQAGVMSAQDAARLMQRIADK